LPARTTTQNWPAYERHFTENVLLELRAVKGYISSQLLKHEAVAEITITVITLWQSGAAIDAFAGPGREAAVVTPNAAALLTSYDRRVQQFQVALADSAGFTPSATKT
jgi:heme-degrading monooxygenase HmoA